MTDIKWIKITTDIFDDEKILLIESLPSADSIIVIWFKLLCLAGKQNNSGVFLLNNSIPYTEKMLAAIFRREESVVHLALQTFEQFGMIEIYNDVITIPNWGKHQNFDSLETKRTYMRNYMREYRQKQRLLTSEAGKNDGKDNCKTNSKANVRKAEVEVDTDTDIETESISSRVSVGSKYYGFNSNVKLTDDEYQRLLDRFDNAEVLINKVSAIIARSHNDAGKHFALCEKVGREDGYEKGEL